MFGPANCEVSDDVDREVNHKDSVYLYRFIRKR